MYSSHFNSNDTPFCFAVIVLWTQGDTLTSTALFTTEQQSFKFFSLRHKNMFYSFWEVRPRTACWESPVGCVVVSVLFTLYITYTAAAAVAAAVWRCGEGLEPSPDKPVTHTHTVWRDSSDGYCGVVKWRSICKDILVKKCWQKGKGHNNSSKIQEIISKLQASKIICSSSI